MHRPQLWVGRWVLLSSAVVGAAMLVPAGASAAAGVPADARQQEYVSAAVDYGIPESLLLGVSYLESRWNTNAGTPSTAAGYGPMHLTDAAYVKSLPVSGHYGPEEDPRGDSPRPTRVADHPTGDAPPGEALQTLNAAVGLTGASATALRTDPAVNIRGGAALLASYQKALAGPIGAASNPAAWYGAVARYSGADSTDAAAAFAEEVYATIREGASRTTDDGHRVVLTARAVAPVRAWLAKLRLHRLASRADAVECPTTVACDWIPAPYKKYGSGAGDYGNHDQSDRPARQQIKYIVIHTTEESWATTLKLVQDPTYASWHYSLRSLDGQIAQHVKTKDIARQAGNWYVNAKSVGLEHEGFAAQGTWYTEAMYRSSAKLVSYLAHKLGVPLDRQHIIGHDNVPGMVPSTVQGMHADPGPYWDWAHYFDLMHAPFPSTGTARTGLVTFDPDFATNRPAFTGCVTIGVPCQPRGSSTVILHRAPREDAPLVNDRGLRPDGTPDTMHIFDHGARASAGQTYAIADRQSDWTAIWYLGQKAWFHNPDYAPTAKWSLGQVATSKPGKAAIPVYGRAYPEATAYPTGVPYQPITPLQYTLPAGQRYVVGELLHGEYYRATTFDGSSPGDWTVISDDHRYVQIQFGHRVMYINLDDVQLLPSPVGAPH